MCLNVLCICLVVLQRSESDGVGLEDTDILQTELETLLSSVAKRMRQLESEIQFLNNSTNGKTESDPPTPPPGKANKKGGKVVSFFFLQDSNLPKKNVIFPPDKLSKLYFSEPVIIF